MADRRSGARLSALAGAVAAVAPLLAGCGLFGGDDDGGTSVFDAEPGMCFLAPEEVQAQVDEMESVPCSEPHDQEAYAVVPFTGGDDAFPGDDALSAFADGHCAQEFRDYVGVDYLDSALYFTYLLPSPRSWEQDDRDVLCLVTAAGEPIEGSVKGTAR
ncbi:septum formation family protein [Nocardioides sp. TF02-7]|uniref:septum formation family protein n=1 Tax=Nocardioides sp. TF02-7 TaxID=2917724 RepID=UPI001F050E8A|nr:septum formation family protein [Nocardioides sp. TF02-7]UMG91027.1 septum formation family protein [Nocardioides sp. TF02-7]